MILGDSTRISNESFCGSAKSKDFDALGVGGKKSPKRNRNSSGNINLIVPTINFLITQN
jgi:hypothetical protein